MTLKSIVALTVLFQALNFNVYADSKCHCPEFRDPTEDSKKFVEALENGSPYSISFEGKTYSIAIGEYLKLLNLKVGENFSKFVYNGCTLDAGKSLCKIKVSCHLHHKSDVCGTTFTLIEASKS